MNKSKLSSKIKDELLYTEGYKLRRQNRNRHVGGVAVYITYILGHTKREDLPVSSIDIISSRKFLH